MIFQLPTKSQGTGKHKSRSSQVTAQSNTNQRLYSLDTDGLKGALEGFLPKTDLALYKLYRQVYQSDAVAGSAVDLMAMLPFSEASLTGISDPKILDIYESTLEQLDIQSLMPQIAVEYMVIGKVIGTLVFNETLGIFTDAIIQDPATCDVTAVPLQGYDPKIDMKVSKDFRKFLTSKDYRDVEARNELSPSLLTKLLSGKVALDPVNTLYLGRKTNPSDLGTSYLSRIIPFFVLEQTLLQGTINSALRRQRAILHITAGDDNWDPTEEQLEDLMDLFIGADMDPLGAVIATKTGIQVNEVKQGGDFWKVTEDWDTITQAKMRALGISEAFLTGDANYSHLDQALSVFIESLRAFRSHITNKTFNTKIFPTLARVHRFIKRTPAELSHNIRVTGTSKTIPFKDLIMPTIQWHKQLQPQYDQNYLDILSIMEEKGVPITLRVWAAAGGMSVKNLLESLDDDLQIKKTISDYKEGLKKLAPAGEEEDMGFSSTRYIPSNKRLKLRDNIVEALKRAERGSQKEATKLLEFIPGSEQASGASPLVGPYS